MVSVAIIDDQRDIREGIQKLLNKTEGFECFGVFCDAGSAIEKIPAHPPDVVLMDIALPDMSGIESIRILKRQLSFLNIIVYTYYSEDESVFSALQAGAHGYLIKPVFPSRLLHAIEEVACGGAPLSASIARRVVASFCPQAASLPSLSEREKDVLHLLCQGRSYKEIARRLFVSTNTIRFHLKNIYQKLDVGSRHEAVIKASRAGAGG